MNNQFDITKHKWSDGDLNCEYGSGDFLEIQLSYRGATPITFGINKDDAIAIAKHFGIIQEIDGQIITIHKAEINLIPQSETTYLNSTKANRERLEESIKQFERGETVERTYASLNLDSVKEMKQSEIIGDLNG